MDHIVVFNKYQTSFFTFLESDKFNRWCGDVVLPEIFMNMIENQNHRGRNTYGKKKKQKFHLWCHLKGAFYMDWVVIIPNLCFF